MLKFISGLLRTKEQFTSKLANLFKGKKNIDPELLEELENILLAADVGSRRRKTQVPVRSR